VFETEEERSGWSGAEAAESNYDDEEDEEEEQGWAGGNAAGWRGESHEDDQEEGSGSGEGRRPRRSRPRELFVCNLPRRCDVDDLYELFKPYGTVLSVEVYAYHSFLSFFASLLLQFQHLVVNLVIYYVTATAKKVRITDQLNPKFY
jgi:RNA recognition motif-containing protein